MLGELHRAIKKVYIDYCCIRAVGVLTPEYDYRLLEELLYA